MALDSSNNLYISGYVGATAYGQTYNGGTRDAALYKVSSEGILRWVRYWGTSAFDFGTGGTKLFSLCTGLAPMKDYLNLLLLTAVDVSSDDRIYLSGYTTGVDASNDMLLAEYNSTGALQISWISGVSGNDIANGGMRLSSTPLRCLFCLICFSRFQPTYLLNFFLIQSSLFKMILSPLRGVLLEHFQVSLHRDLTIW